MASHIPGCFAVGSCSWSDVATDNGDNDLCDAIDYGEGNGDKNPYDWWYLGATQCSRANVAFSLYGTLVGDDESEGCKKSTYINSFFTTRGIEPFIEAMSEAGVSYFASGNANNVNSYCTIIQGDVDDGYAYDDDSFEKYAYGTHNQAYFSGFYSQAMMCKRGKFVKQNFEGASCNVNKATKTVDTLANLNTALGSLSCVPIYTADGGDGRRRRTGGQQQDQQQDDAVQGSLQLLKYSAACSLQDPSGACPDPFGKVKAYSKRLARASHSLDPSVSRRYIRRRASWILAHSGLPDLHPSFDEEP
jgi:hypothetical protein